MDIKITFPGGKKVNAEVDGLIITTDQTKLDGGENTAPSPYFHFLASIGTCAGSYILYFCHERKIPTDGITLTERLEFATTPEGKAYLDTIAIDINVPPGFPEKYHKALIKVVDQCAVKKAILRPPKFAINTVIQR
jgi:ribosomal protein S12 methylthiotransferase accessory factor